MQFAAERVVIAIGAMICLRMGISSRPHILKFGLRDRGFVGGQRMRAGGAGCEQKNRDKRRENSEREASKLSVGQGQSPQVINIYSQPRKQFFNADFADQTRLL